MGKGKRTPEEQARREKIRELLQLGNIGSMDDIQALFRETIAEFMECVLPSSRSIGGKKNSYLVSTLSLIMPRRRLCRLLNQRKK